MLGAGHKETIQFLPVQSIPAALSLSTSGCGLELDLSLARLS